ncbi:MAG TPA: FmdE family protein [Bacteroidales bacterium]|nr:FmdE family protein [Bacteroidales bacterium]
MVILLYNTAFSQSVLHDAVKIAIYTDDPRKEIMNNIENGRTDLLLIQAGQLHGHYCPGLAMGVMAAYYAIKEMKADSISMEGLRAIIETRNCVADGVQFVTGCTVGNGSLIYKDTGKTSLTLVNKDGKGIRICSKQESPDIINATFPAFQEYYQKVVVKKSKDSILIAKYKQASLDRNFGTLNIPFNKLFTIQHIKIKIPVNTGKNESVVCSVCGESVKKTKATEVNGKIVCATCSNAAVGTFDENGIHF